VILENDTESTHKAERSESITVEKKEKQVVEPKKEAKPKAVSESAHGIPKFVKGIINQIVYLLVGNINLQHWSSQLPLTIVN